MQTKVKTAFVFSSYYWLNHPVTIMIRMLLLDLGRKDGDFIYPPKIKGTAAVSEVICQ